MNAFFACMLCLLLPGSPQSAPSDPDADRLNEQLLEAHNKARAEAKLPPLAIDPKLTEAARRHAKDMAEHEKMTHEGSDGSHPDERVKRAGYHFVRTGENVAEGQKDVEHVLESWMNSPEHKANILGKFTQMGAARATDESGEPYWCVDFGTPIVRQKPAEAAAGVVEKLNAARKEAKLAPLQIDEKLAGVARKMAEAAAEADDQHPEKAEQPRKQELPDLVKLVRAAGVEYSGLSQYMASGAPTAEDVVKSMLEQEGEKKMVLGAFKSIGVGYANGADDRPYWCVLLVEP